MNKGLKNRTMLANQNQEEQTKGQKAVNMLFDDFTQRYNKEYKPYSIGSVELHRIEPAPLLFSFSADLREKINQKVAKKSTKPEQAFDLLIGEFAQLIVSNLDKMHCLVQTEKAPCFHISKAPRINVAEDILDLPFLQNNTTFTHTCELATHRNTFAIEVRIVNDSFSIRFHSDKQHMSDVIAFFEDEPEKAILIPALMGMEWKEKRNAFSIDRKVFEKELTSPIRPMVNSNTYLEPEQRLQLFKEMGGVLAQKKELIQELGVEEESERTPNRRLRL